MLGNKILLCSTSLSCTIPTNVLCVPEKSPNCQWPWLHRSKLPWAPWLQTYILTKCFKAKLVWTLTLPMQELDKWPNQAKEWLHLCSLKCTMFNKFYTHKYDSCPIQSWLICSVCSNLKKIELLAKFLLSNMHINIADVAANMDEIWKSSSSWLLSHFSLAVKLQFNFVDQKNMASGQHSILAMTQMTTNSKHRHQLHIPTRSDNASFIATNMLYKYHHQQGVALLLRHKCNTKNIPQHMKNDCLTLGLPVTKRTYLE